MCVCVSVKKLVLERLDRIIGSAVSFLFENGTQGNSIRMRHMGTLETAASDGLSSSECPFLTGVTIIVEKDPYTV